MRSIGYFIALFAFALVFSARPAQAGSRDICAQSANVLLRESGTYNQQTGQVSYFCLCNIPQSDYKQYMEWCDNQATGPELSELIQDMRQSICANPASMARCVRN